VAKQVITRLLDDLSGGPADQTIIFAYGGSSYSIDLSDANAEKFRTAILPWIEAGTRIGTARPGGVRFASAPSKQSMLATREENNRIREWASRNGYQVSDRGRIPVHVVEAFESNTPNPAWVAVEKAKQAQAAKSAKAAGNGARTSAPRQRARATSAVFRTGSR
jgi:nucleoid-associated protein Lsr2